MPSHSQIMTTAEILDRLRQATVDLLWLSESDYPFEVISWERGVEMTPTALFKELAQPDLQVEAIELANFFAPALAIEDWYEAEELAQVDRYQELLHAIEANLTDVRVFRVGEIEITIYIVGKTPDGDVVGLKTQVVET
jgi:Nuclease A inhibitor-like protein